jgi:BASS family bile acid:Na+ symporter
VRKLYPPAREWPKKTKTATFSLWSITLFIIAAIAADFFKKNPEISLWIVGETALIALIICAVNFSVGYLLGEKGLRHEASQSLGQKNTTLTIYLALVYAGPLAAMGVISYVLWHNSYNAIQFFLHDRKKNRLEK